MDSFSFDGRREWAVEPKEICQEMEIRACAFRQALVWLPRILKQIAGWSSPAARQAHNLKVLGTNPSPATIFKRPERFRSGLLL